MSCDGLGDGHNDGVAKLAVRLGVGNRDLEGGAPWSVKAHEASALTGGQAARAWVIGLTDEYLRTILEISCGQSPSNIVRTEETEPKAISLAAVLRGIGLKVVPEMLGESVAGVNFGEAALCVPGLGGFGPVFGMQDRAQPWAGGRIWWHHALEGESGVVQKAGDEDAFTMLRNPRPPV